METAVMYPNPVETASAPELAFADVDAIEVLRREQNDALYEAGKGALDSLTVEEAFERGAQVRAEARAQAMSGFDRMCDVHLTQNMERGQDPEKYDLLAHMLKSVSVHNMDPTKWYQGDKDENGEDIPGSSGRDQVRAVLSQLRVEAPDAPDTTVTEEISVAHDEYEALKNDLKAKREALAEVSIKRRRLISKNTKRARQLDNEFNTLQLAYQEKFIALSAEDIKRLRLEGKTPEEIHAAAVRKTLDEHKAFSEAEWAVLDQDDSRRARFARWYARKRNMIATNVVGGFGVGVGIGYGVKQAAKGAAVLASGAVAPAAITLGLAARTTKAVLVSSVGTRANQITMFEKRWQTDHKHLESMLGTITIGTENLIDRLSANLQDKITTRAEADRRSNRNRVILAAGVAGVSGLAGAYVAEHFINSGTHHAINHPPHTPPKPYSPPPTPPSTPSPAPTPPPNPNVIDGFQTNINVGNGAGYTNELQQLAAEKGIQLNGAQSWNAYLSLAHQFNGNFFANDPSYVRAAGDFGISRPGAAVWNPAVLQSFQAWLEQNNLASASS